MTIVAASMHHAARPRLLGDFLLLLNRGRINVCPQADGRPLVPSHKRANTRRLSLLTSRSPTRGSVFDESGSSHLFATQFCIAMKHFAALDDSGLESPS